MQDFTKERQRVCSPDTCTRSAKTMILRCLRPKRRIDFKAVRFVQALKRRSQSVSRIQAGILGGMEDERRDVDPAHCLDQALL